MNLDEMLSEIFIAAYNKAKMDNHEYITPEHILYAALFFDKSREIIINCGISIEELKGELLNYFKENIPLSRGKEPVQTTDVRKIISYAEDSVLYSDKNLIEFSDVLLAMYDYEESFASYFLKKQNVKRVDILDNIYGKDIKDYLWDDISLDYEEDGEDSMYDEDGYTLSRQQELLNLYAVELTEKAVKGELDPLIGREDILKRTIQVLSRRTKNNPIHVGEPGVGKTAITEGLAQLIVKDQVPRGLKNNKIYSLDMASLIAGTKYRGDFEDRIKKVLNIIKKQENAIVYIDEIHTVVGTGSVSGSSMDASNILKPFLTDGKLKVIGSTTYDEYKKYFEKDRALSRRFQKIEVPEPTKEDAYKILLGLKSTYEMYHNVEYTDKALKSSVELSSKYIHERYLPDKAIDVMDEAAALIKLEDDNDTKKIKITEKEIETVVASMAKIPKKSISINEKEMLKNLDKNLKEKIFGQDEAVDSIVKAIKRSRAGFNDEQKPVASLLFVGQTGVGKTAIVKRLSECLNVPLIRFDMSEYQEKHTVARLIGSPPGYIGYEEGGLLTDSIRKTPYCILLLDEIEKAHPDIFNLLLQIMDYATLTDNNGKKADFRNVILIMTSNAGARDIGRNVIGFGSRVIQDDAINKELDNVFSPEFRNRLDDIILFNSMDSKMAYRIAKKAIDEFRYKLSLKNIQIKVTERCYKWIAKKGVFSNYGAREILRVVQKNIKPYFVDEVLFGSLSKGGRAVIDVVGGNIKINKVEKVRKVSEKSE